MFNLVYWHLALPEREGLLLLVPYETCMYVCTCAGMRTNTATFWVLPVDPGEWSYLETSSDRRLQGVRKGERSSHPVLLQPQIGEIYNSGDRGGERPSAERTLLYLTVCFLAGIRLLPSSSRRIWAPERSSDSGWPSPKYRSWDWGSGWRIPLPP